MTLHSCDHEYKVGAEACRLHCINRLAVEPRVPSSETELLQHVLDIKVLPCAGILPVAPRRLHHHAEECPACIQLHLFGLKCQRCMQYKDQSYSPRMLLDKFLQKRGVQTWVEKQRQPESGQTDRWETLSPHQFRSLP